MPTFELRETVHALIYGPDYAGCGPDHVVHAAWDHTELARLGERKTGRGSIRIRELTMPQSIRTLLDRGAEIGVCGDGYEVGCWFHGKPWETLVPDGKHPRFEWRNEAERNFLEACRLASGYPGWPQDRDITGDLFGVPTTF